jgi:hypothetical protein
MSGRRTGRRVVLSVASMCMVGGGIVSAALSAATAGVQAKKPQGQSVTVSGEACVRSGVEAGCVILATWDEKAQAKDKFLVLGGTKLKAGTVVRFNGVTKPDAITTCMEGTPLEVRGTPVVLRMDCPLDR